tara:strand:- start:1789 stop:2595 length:807 start_codon:yes stop_codon:yes gene_type:complete
MKSLIKCISCTFFCLLLIGCSGQNKVSQNAEEVAEPVNNSDIESESNQNIKWLNQSQSQTENNQFASTEPLQQNVIGENTDLNLASVVKSSSIEATPSIGNSVPTEIQSNYENCGPASLASVFRYHGLSDSQSQIAQKTTNGNGAGTTDLVDYAVSRGFNNTREISRDFHGDSLTALQNRVSQRPQIVVVGPQSGNEIIYNYPQSLNPEKNWGGNFFRSSPNNHYVVVQSFTPEGNPILMDPARAELGRVVADRDWFDRHWIHTVDVS